MNKNIPKRAAPRHSREQNTANLKQIQDIFYQQIDAALVGAPEASYADILAALNTQCDNRIRLNQNDEFARVMQMTIRVMQHYYARLHPDHAPAEWLERE